MIKNYGITAKFIFFCLLPVFSFLDFYTESYLGKDQVHNPHISDIIETYNVLEEAYEDFEDKITFEIAGSQPALGGSSVKFVLDGSDGNKWLFKNGSYLQSIAAFKLARLFGINSPEIYTVSLSINGRRCVGQAQKYIKRCPEAGPHQGRDFLKQNQQELIKLQVFHWLINKREDTFYHIMLDEENKANSIDLKLTLEYPEKTLPKSFKEKFYSRGIFPDYEFFRQFWGEYLEYFEERPLRIPSGFMCYVENFSDNYIARLLEEDEIAGPDIDKFIKLKQSICGDFGRFLLFVQSLKKKGLDIRFNGNPQQHAQSVLNTLKSCLKDKQNALESMPEKEQSPLNVVTSCFFKESLRNRTNKQALGVIEEKKKEALNTYELLGLYLLEAKILKDIKGGAAQGDAFLWEEVVISLGCEDLSPQFIQSEVKFLPEEKRPFVMALYHAVNNK